MRKTILSGLLAIAVCLCAGCTESPSGEISGTASKPQNTEAVSNGKDSDSETAVFEKTYPNLEFAEYFAVIQPESVQALSRMTCTAKEPISQSAMQEIFDKALTDIFSDRFTQTELEQFRKEMQVQEHMLFLENEKMGLTVVQPGYVHAYNRGIALALDEMPGPANIYFPSESHPVLQTYQADQLDSKDSYTLTDGTCTIQEAVQIVEQQLQAESAESPFVPKVHQVQAVSLTDAVQVLQMEIALSYENLPFDCADVSEYGMFSYSSLMERTPEQKRSYEFLPASVLLSSKDGIDFQVGLQTDRTVAVQETQETWITPEGAMDAASAYLTQNIVFQVEQMELVYSSYTVGEELAVSQMDPVWKIRMYNTNDRLYYTVHVDAFGGTCVECYSYVKES